jgi:hypothetical protein
VRLQYIMTNISIVHLQFFSTSDAMNLHRQILCKIMSMWHRVDFFFCSALKFIVLAQNIAFVISITQDSACILFGFPYSVIVQRR